MPTIPFYMAGQIGIIKDAAPHELPPQGWSDGRNVRFRDGKVSRRDGQQRVYGTGQLGRPYWVGLTYTPTNVYWVYADLTKLYATDGASHAEVTRVSGPYSSLDLDYLWNGGILTGIPVFTNGKDKPQAWTNIGLTNDFIDLPNWPASHITKLIRPFKNFLVAMNISRGGNNYPNLVLWSHPADPGSVPSSWDVADPTKLAGELDVADEFVGGVKNGLALRDSFIIYKDNSVWGMQFIGGSSVMRFYQILGGIGILGPHAVTQMNQGRQHLFASSDDLIVFDGQSTDSILDKKWKQYLASHIDPSVAQRSFTFALERNTEVFFFYPELGNQFPNMALIWNWKDNTITQRDTAELISSAAVGPVTIAGDPWDLDTSTWDSDTTIWDLQNFRASAFDMLGSFPGVDLATSKLMQLGVTQQMNGVDFTAFVERTDIALIGEDRVNGGFKADFEMRKIMKRIWPRVEGSPVLVSVGSQETLGGGVTWEPQQLFTPGVDKYLDFLVNGRLIAVRFESSTQGVWYLDGYNLEIEPLGGL